jgi:hypothetical protein
MPHFGCHSFRGPMLQTLPQIKRFGGKVCNLRSPLSVNFEP